MNARSILTGLLLAALIGLSLAGWQATRISAPALASRLGTELEQALAQPVRFASAELSWQPWPSLSVADLRIGSETAPWLRIPRLDGALSLLGLLAGQPALRGLELRGAELQIAPRALFPGRGGIPAAPASGAPDPAAQPRLPAFLSTSLRIRDGTLHSAALDLEQVQASGGLESDGELSLRGSAALPGSGPISDLELRLRGLLGPASGLRWESAAELDGFELRGLRSALGLSASVAGQIEGRVRLTGTGSRLERAELELAARDLDLRQPPLVATGRATLEGALPGALALDLGATSLTVRGQLQKRPGWPLRLELECANANVDPDPDPDPDARKVASASIPCAAPSALALVADPLELRGQLAEGALRVTGLQGAIDVAALRPWWSEAAPATAGFVRVVGGTLDLSGTRALDLALERVELPRLLARDPEEAAPRTTPPARSEAGVSAPAPLASGPPPPRPPLYASGNVSLEGQELVSPALELEWAGQRASASGRYDLSTARAQLQLAGEDLDLGALTEAYRGEPLVLGELDIEGDLSGTGLADLRGSLRVNVRRGYVPWARLPWPPELDELRRNLPEKGEEFQQIVAAFSLDGPVARFQTLALDHPLLQLQLQGDVAIPSGELDLRGEFLLSAELDGAVGGPGRVQELPIRHVTGFLPTPGIEMDKDRMSEVLLRYAAFLKAGEERRAREPEASDSAPAPTPAP